jgi:MoaA/NifB/PqqE/SkfB family radical SAM enzyme
LLCITADFPEIIFPVFTNGLLVNAETIKELKKQKHVAPIISIEGYEDATDDRRGAGVYAHLLKTMQAMKDAGLFFGNSMTVTRQNFGSVTDAAFVKKLMSLGSRAFFFLDYVPVEAGTDELILTDAQRSALLGAMTKFRATLPGLFIGFPMGEEEFGGCLAAGRGFVHVSPEGRLEPCPVSPFSDTSLKDVSLREALGSRLLQTIREHGEELTETRGGCALFERREWLSALASGESR